MLLLKKPSEEAIEQFIEGQASLNFSYAEVGASKDGVCPSRYGTDHVRGDLGIGANIFARSVNALERWEQFGLSWVKVYPHNALIIPNTVVAVLAWHGGFWSLNACRIVYTINEQAPLVRFGFGYGTLPDHVETGEERFLLEWDKNTDIVTYDILAFLIPVLCWGGLLTLWFV